MNDAEFIKCPNCDFPAYRISDKRTYNCQKCKFTFTNEEVKPKENEEVKLNEPANISNKDFSRTSSNKTLTPKKAAYTGVTIATVAALIFLAVTIIYLSCNNASATTEDKTHLHDSAYQLGLLKADSVSKAMDSLGHNVTTLVSSKCESQTVTSGATPETDQAYTISKNFVDDYVTDVSYGFVENPIVLQTGNTYTISYHFSVDHIKYNYECTMAYLGGVWSYKEHWKLLSLYIEGKEFYYDENYKKYIKH